MTKLTPNELETSLLATISSSDLAELPGDLVDAFAGLPIASALTKIGRAVGDVRDYLFRKKVLQFFASVSEVPAHERQEQISKILADKDERQRFAEQLLLSLERFDDTRKAAIMGNLTVGLLKGELSLLEFWRMNRAVEAISLDEEWPTLQVIERYKDAYYKDNRPKAEGWSHEGVLRKMINDDLGLNMSDGDLRSVVIRLNQTGLFGCLGWRKGPAHDCEIAPWYFTLRRYMRW